jgi:predicted ATPase
MEEREIVLLAKANLNVNAMPMEVLDMLVRRCEGNPLFCERLIKRLLARKIIKVRVDSSGHSHVLLLQKDLLYFVRIDPGLMTMLRARLDKLTGPLQRTLKMASVIASCGASANSASFSVHLLGYLDLSFKRLADQAQLNDRLQELEDQALIERVVVQDPEGTSSIFARTTSIWKPPEYSAPLVFRFRSILVRDVIYRSMMFAERQALHGILARSIEHQIAAALISRDASLQLMISTHWLKWNELIAEHYSQSNNARGAFIR